VRELAVRLVTAERDERKGDCTMSLVPAAPPVEHRTMHRYALPST
jgi:hypothetical protein